MKEKEIKKYHYQKDKPTSRQFDIYDLNEYYQDNHEAGSHPHTHSFYQIIWFKNKEGKHFIDFSDHEIKENRLFFIAKNQVHYFQNRSDYEGLLIHFNESFILSNEIDLNFFLTYNIFNCEEPYFQIPDELKNVISSYFEQIYIEAKNKDAFGNKLVLSNLLKSMLLLVEREKRQYLQTERSTINQNSTFLQFRDLVEKNFNKNWAVNEYATALTVSPKTLNNLIKENMGLTVSQAITDRVILEAKRQLTHSNAYINEIAFDLGFKDPYYFIRYFKKHVKCSPTAFRKSMA